MLNINPKYENDIRQYCKLNNIEDVNLFVTQCFKQGFDIKKYGFLGNSLNEDEKHLKTEVIVEKRIEIPVEVIKEIIVEKEVIKEVPVDKIIEKEVIKEIIKEVPVEVIVEKEVIKEIPVEKVVTKIEYICDKTNEDELVLKIIELENIISKKDESLDDLRRTLDEKPTEIKVTEYIEKVIIDTENEKNLLQQIENLEKLISKKDESLDELRHNLDELLDELEIEKLNIKTIEVIKEVEKPNDKTKLLEGTLLNLKKELSLKDKKINELEIKNKQLEEIKIDKNVVYLNGTNLKNKM
jgi:hypothetical protein